MELTKPHIITPNKAKRRLIVIIDHELGGGANLYSSFVTNSLRKNNFAVLLISYNFHSKKFRLSYNGHVLERGFFLDISTTDWMKDLFKTLKPDYIFTNELVSWLNPLNLTGLITQLNIPYILFVHDYFFICPSWNLIDNAGKCCNVPDDLEICKQCLIDNQFSDSSSFYGDALTDISLWRENMYSFLQKADSIVCFSQSSKNYLLKAYNDLPNILISEHSIPDMEPFIWKSRKLNRNAPLTIAVLGNTGFHKGGGILQDVICHPDYGNLPVKTVIIGTASSFSVECNSDKGGIIVTGKYKRENLYRILEKYNVSAVLIPSICPETFSFTTSEALLLGYPVICFDIGAPAERIKKYNSGIVVDNLSAAGIIKAFKEILGNPQVINELSANTKNYIPSTPQEHLEILLNTIECKSLASSVLKANPA